MRHSDLIESIDESLALLLDVADDYIDEIAEELAVVNSPEKLIGKPYEQFTPQDFQMLSQVYGDEPNQLSNLIFEKSYKKVKELEEEEA